MPSLDARGIIAAAQIGFYAPVAATTIFLVFHYAFRRDAGWFFLFLFSIVRMVGGALLVAAELKQKNIDLFIAAYIIQMAGFSLLYLAAIGFLGMAGQHTYSQQRRVSIIFRLAGIVAVAAAALSVAGGLLGTHVAPTKSSTGLLLRRVAAGIYAGLFVAVALSYIGAWTYRWHLRSYRRHMLYGITCAIPFIGVRAAYAILAAWSSSDLFGQQSSSNPTFARFNPITGDWVPFLVMGIIMEYAAALIFLFASTWLARRKY